VVICLERGADLHMAQLKPLPRTVSCFSKIQIGFTLLVPAHLGSPGKRAVKRVCINTASHLLKLSVVANCSGSLTGTRSEQLAERGLSVIMLSINTASHLLKL